MRFWVASALVRSGGPLGSVLREMWVKRGPGGSGADVCVVVGAETEVRLSATNLRVVEALSVGRVVAAVVVVFGRGG